MAKAKTMFVCAECGFSSAKWLGRCPECQTWDALVEQTPPPVGAAHHSAVAATLDQAPEVDARRRQTGLGELDRVLGGGVVPGSVVLLAGEPGIGKSTLLLQAAAGLADHDQRLLYVSGEESPSQIRLRAQRLNLDLKRLVVAAENNLEAVLSLAENEKWDVLALDSVQSVGGSGLGAAPGSLGAIRDAATRLIGLAKSKNRSVWLVGHVTKEGSIAGPKVLEHMVDTVLYFEGQRSHNLRILRSFKNRFGSLNEIGVFEMKERGLVEVANPSALFLSERPRGASGSVVVSTLEGARPLLVELQALVSASGLNMPRRQALGVDPSRVSLLTAVLEKKIGLRLYDRDVFVNVTGGVKIVEPAVDLGLAAALISSYHDRAAPAEAVFIGEVGLAGEIRGVSRLDVRLREAEKLGFTTAFLPLAEARRPSARTTLELIGAESLTDLMARLI